MYHEQTDCVRTDGLLQKEVIPMFLRTVAVALVAMCSLLASQTTPQPGQAAPRLGQPAPDFALPDKPRNIRCGQTPDDLLLDDAAHTEFPRKYVILVSDGVKAVKQFLDSGDLPACINRKEV